MLFVLVGWVLFRAADLTTAAAMLGAMAGLHGFGGTFQQAPMLAVGALISVLVPSAHEIKDGLLRPRPAAAAALGLLSAWCILKVGKGAPLTFIYFQF